MFTKCVNEVTRLTLFFTSKLAPASRRTLVRTKLLLLKAFMSAVSPYCIVEGGERDRYSRAKKQYAERKEAKGTTLSKSKSFWYQDDHNQGARRGNLYLRYIFVKRFCIYGLLDSLYLRCPCQRLLR